MVVLYDMFTRFLIYFYLSCCRSLLCFFFFFFLMIRRPRRSPLFPSTTLFRSDRLSRRNLRRRRAAGRRAERLLRARPPRHGRGAAGRTRLLVPERARHGERGVAFQLDRKSTRLNSSHSQISYAVFCLKKKKKH